MVRAVVPSLLVAALLVLTPAIVFSGAITVYPPNALDTTATYQPSGHMGSLSGLDRMFVGQGDSVNLILLGSSYDSGDWLVLRTTRDGALIDSQPRLLITDPALSSTFTPRFIEWRAPYFYIYRIWPEFDSNSQWQYLRIRSDLSSPDLAPIPLVPNHTNYPAEIWSDTAEFWQIDWISPAYRVWLNTWPSGEQILDNVSLPGCGTYSPAIAANPQGLIVAARNYQDTTLLNTLVRRDGSVIVLDSVTFADSGTKTFRSFSIFPYHTDSALACWFERATDGTNLLRYYFLDATGAILPIMPREIVLPFLDLSFSRTHRFLLSGDTLTAVTRASGLEVAFYQFDISATQLLQATVVMDSLGPDYNHFGGCFLLGDRLHYYYLQFSRTSLYGNGYAPQELVISTLPPAAAINDRSLIFSASHLLEPWLTTDESGVEAFCRVADSGEYHLAHYRINDPTAPPISGPDEFGTGGLSGNPTVYSVDDRKVLLWDERLPDSGVVTSSSFENRAVLFDGEFPSQSDLTGQLILRKLPSTIYTGKRPLIAQIDSLLYVSHCTYYTSDDWSYRVNHRLRAIDLSTNTLTPLALRVICEGQADFFASKDTLLYIVPSTYCEEHDNTACYSHYESFEARYVVDTQVVRTTSFLSGGVGYYGPLYTSVTGTRSTGGQLLALNQPQQIWEFDDTDRAFHRRAYLSGLLTGILNYDQQCVLHPVETPNAHCVAALSMDNRSLRLLAFDRNWQFVDSTTIVPIGRPREFSNFVYDSSSGRICFAYSTWIADRYASHRIFFQSAKVDIVTDIPDDQPSLPRQFSLSQNYPNPFNPTTAIRFYLQSRTHTRLQIYNVLGELVATLVDAQMAAGQHELTWDGLSQKGLPAASGIYLYRLEAGDQATTRKMILLK